VKPKLAPAPPAETPEQLRARVRASLLRRRPTRAADVTHGEVGNPGALVQADNKVLAYRPWDYIVVE
jgi:hypothetical protein